MIAAKSETGGKVSQAKSPAPFKPRPPDAEAASHLHPTYRVQQAAGNQAVQRLLRAGAIRPKLSVGAPSDPAEQEADRVADRIVSSPPAATVQRKCACGGKSAAGDDCTECNSKENVIRRSPTGKEVEAEAEAGAEAGAAAADVLPAEGEGRPLDASSRDFMESRFGEDFGHVRVHTGERAAASARAVTAEAYTVGRDVVFGAGRYAPESTEGKRLLAHELTHVVQNGNAAPQAQPSIRRQPLGGGKLSPPPPDVPVGLLAQFPPKPRFGFPGQEQEEDPSALRFTNRSFPSGAISLPCPKQACHGYSDKPRLTVPADRLVTTPRLLRWALESGTSSLLNNVRLVQLQIKPGSEEELVQKEYVALGNNVLNSHEFEGPDQARQDAVEALAFGWGEVGPALFERLSRWLQQKYAEAIERTPPGATLVSDEQDYLRVLTQPFGLTAPTGRWEQEARVGERYGAMQIKDIGTGTVWFSLIGSPWWIYEMSFKDFVEWDPFVARFAQETAEMARFAAELMPFMIKVAGFGLGLSGNVAFVIAGIVLTEFAEEWQRDLRGEPGRSFEEIVTSGVKELLIDRVMNRVFSPVGGGAKKGLSEGADVTARGRALVNAVEEPAAAATKREVASAEAPRVAGALRSKGARRVEDEALRREGYVVEVEIIQFGQRHMYRQLENGRWCRFSAVICDLELGDDVANAVKSASEVGLETTRGVIKQAEHELSVIQRVYDRLRGAGGRERGRIDTRTLSPAEREVLDDYSPTGRADDLTLAELRELPKTHGIKRDYKVAEAAEARLIAQLRHEARPLYDKMRAASPRTKERRMVLGESRGLDAASGASPRSGNLDPDHIVPVREIVDMDGFARMDFDDQVEVVNDMKNFRAIDRQANNSRGDRTWAEWPQASKFYDAPALARMRKLEDELRGYLEKEIARRLKRSGRR
ncbi:MAG: DUF4157 domain-containing protein [Pyrinomonadaceae bacterium]